MIGFGIELSGSGGIGGSEVAARPSAASRIVRGLAYALLIGLGLLLGLAVALFAALTIFGFTC